MRHFNGSFSKKDYESIGYVMVAVSFFATLPQLIQVYETHSVEDISLITWVMYTAISSFWLMYGLKQKFYPLMFSGMVNVMIDIVMIAGLLMFR